MAEEKEPKEEPKEEPRKEPKEEPKEEPKRSSRERSDDSPAPTETPKVKCPDCRVPVDVDELGSHRYLAHKVERRESGKRSEDKENDKEGDTPRTPKRKAGSTTDDKGAGSGTQPGKGRWSKVRSGWG